jgi:hypothetical protein
VGVKGREVMAGVMGCGCERERGDGRSNNELIYGIIMNQFILTYPIPPTVKFIQYIPHHYTFAFFLIYIPITSFLPPAASLPYLASSILSLLIKTSYNNIHIKDGEEPIDE